MEDNNLERIITNSIQIGVIKTLSELGLISENITEKQAERRYGRKQIQEWRAKGWIVGYPSGNKERSKVYFKRSELETASRMLDLQNTIPANRIHNFNILRNANH
jgi:hypothetical protein